MLTRHFLSHRTTANCCRLLLHIKVNISQVKFHISHEIEIPIILIFSLITSDSFWWNSPFLSSTLSWMVSKFILEWCVKFMFTWDVKSHSYGFTPWWPLHSIITNALQWLHFTTKGQLSFLKESDVFDPSTKTCIVLLHAYADEYDGWLCSALSIFTHTCCVCTLYTA